MTQKDLFIKYLGEMNLDMLDIILSEKISYFGTSKTTFIQKLHDLVKASFALNNKPPDLIQHAKRKNIYYLKITGYMFSTKIIIEHCNGLLTAVYNNKRINNLEQADDISEFDFVVWDDEKDNFVADTEYVMNVYRCEQAIEEIHANQPLNVSIIFSWFQDYSNLYETAKKKFRYLAYKKFRNLYFALEFLSEALNYAPALNEALLEFDPVSAEHIAGWLEDWNRLYYCHTMGHDQFNVFINRKRNLVYYGREKLCFSDPCIMDLMNFNLLFKWYEFVILQRNHFSFATT